MAHTAYLTLRGAKQGLISGGCNTKDSMGNRYQENHTDQITVLACHFAVRKEPHQHGLSRDSVHITKHIDKATPLLATAFARQEYLEGSIDFYRTNEKGYNEKFYSIALQKAVISGINSDSPHAVLAHDQEMNETISFRYKGMQLEHLLCGTMASDGWESDNALSVMQGYQDVLARKPTPAPVPEQKQTVAETTQVTQEDYGYNQHIILEDQDGNPLAGIPYRLIDNQGIITEGITGADGRTATVFGHNSNTLDFEIAQEAGK